MRVAIISVVAAAAAAASLQPLVFQPLRTGTVLPRGWLKDELIVQANGLGGHIPQFWSPFNNSQWIGGTDNFEDWPEILPYVIDGFTPLALLLEDEVLMATANSTLTYILDHARADGWLGPDLGNGNGMEYWIVWPVLKAMFSWAEATGDTRMLPAALTYLHTAYTRMTTVDPLGYSWQSVRWADYAVVTQYLLDAAFLPVPPSETAFLLNLTTAIYDQSLKAGVDFENVWFKEGWFPTQAVPGNECNLTNHGVNTGMAVKSGSILYRLTGEQLGIDSSYERLALLDKYHGVPTGVFQADEHLAGAMPSHGTETCTVAELMFSHNVIHETLGDALFAERAELIAYNAMPGAMTKDMWARVYLQFMNTFEAVPETQYVWISDGPDASIFSLEGNYACCTANFHQAWPKFVAKMVHSTRDGGVAISLLGPVSAALPNGVSVIVDTQYPFGDDLNITVSGVPLSPGGMPFYLRIPSWATGATLSLNGEAPLSVGAANGTMFALNLTLDSNFLVFNTNPSIRVSTWFNAAVAVLRGALVYSLQFNETLTVTHQWAQQSRDFNVTMSNTSIAPWNVALVMDPTDPGASLTFHRLGDPSPIPFASQESPVSITATARAIPTWTASVNAPSGPPASPIDCATIQGGCGAPITVTLVPYGTTHIRMTEMPYILP